MSKTLSHLGYTGSIEHDLKDKCLFGQLLYVNDIITYQGDTIAELEASFTEAVTEYIQTCREIGKLPEKPFSGTFNVRIKPEVHRKLAYKAAETGATINQLVSQAVETLVNDDLSTETALPIGSRTQTKSKTIRREAFPGRNAQRDAS